MPPQGQLCPRCRCGLATKVLGRRWGGGAAPAARRVHSRERIKGRTKLLSQHVLLWLPPGVLSIQSSASAGQCRRWSDVSSAAPVPGIGPFSGRGTISEVCCLGWGPERLQGATALWTARGEMGLCAVQVARRRLLPPALSSTQPSGIGVGTRLPENWFV